MNFSNKNIAYLALVGILLHAGLRLSGTSHFVSQLPLYPVLLGGGGKLVFLLLINVLKREFGSDLLAGISIVVSIILGEYLAGALVVLMLSGGEAVEEYAMGRASDVLNALAKRMPSIAHRKTSSAPVDIAISEIQVGDTLVVLPHELCPVDGTVIEGQSSMDESYLTGEPYFLSKSSGSNVISGAINGEGGLTIRADKLAIDSRYAKIMQVMDATKQHRPRLRRLGDTLGAFYTPVAVIIALCAWYYSGEASRFLAVLVVATPCPLLIAIPVAIIGAISLCAKRSIIIRDPTVLELADKCKVLIFDKTGTLTYGKPEITEILTTSNLSEKTLLQLAAALERYSKHPLARPIIDAAQDQKLDELSVSDVSELPGKGLSGIVGERRVSIVGRKHFPKEDLALLPAVAPGLECIVLLDGRYAGLIRMRDEPREEGAVFVKHLGPRHGVNEVILLSGDRENEVEYLANKVGIKKIYFGKSPDEKVSIVKEETKKHRTLFLGDGINDAPALLAATVGIAFGPRSEITSEAAGAVILDPTLRKVDELMHISRRMRSVAVQSAVGGMALSIFGMGFAAYGLLTPVAGAILQEAIDVLAVFNALRAALPPKLPSHF